MPTHLSSVVNPDLVGFTGVGMVETDDTDERTTRLLKRNAMVDVESVPVLDDKEARKLGREVLG